MRWPRSLRRAPGRAWRPPRAPRRRSRRHRSRNDYGLAFDAEPSRVDELSDLRAHGLARAADKGGHVGVRQAQLDARSAGDRDAVLGGELAKQMLDAVPDPGVGEIFHRVARVAELVAEHFRDVE